MHLATLGKMYGVCLERISQIEKKERKMYNSRGADHDATVWHCKACGWSSKVLSFRESPGVSACPECKGVLHWIDYDAATESDAVLALLGTYRAKPEAAT